MLALGRWPATIGQCYLVGPMELDLPQSAVSGFFSLGHSHEGLAQKIALASIPVP